MAKDGENLVPGDKIAKNVDLQIFPRARLHSVVGVVVAFVIAALTFYVVFIIGLEGMRTLFDRGGAIYYSCVFLLTCSAIALPLAVRAAVKRDNGILIDQEGVFDQLSLNGVIPWANIIGAQQGKPGDDASSLWIIVRDRNAYYRNWLTRYLTYRRPNEIFLFAWGLRSSNELYEKINAIAPIVNREKKKAANG